MGGGGSREDNGAHKPVVGSFITQTYISSVSKHAHLSGSALKVVPATALCFAGPGAREPVNYEILIQDGHFVTNKLDTTRLAVDRDKIWKINSSSSNTRI